MFKIPQYSSSVFIFFKKNAGLLIAVSFFTIILCTAHFDRAFQYDPDEGLYLMRALLYSKGYVLYQQVWMDQPPALVLILSLLFKIFGPSVFIARLFILSCSSALLWALFQMISRKQDRWSAMVAVLFLVFSSSYVKLSVSVTGDLLPATFSVIAIYLVMCYQTSYQKRFLLLSGAFFALASLIKFLALLFLPTVLFEIAIAYKDRLKTDRHLLKLSYIYALWATGFLAVFMSIALIITSVDFYQIWHPYVLGRKLHSYLTLKNFLWVKKDGDLLLMAFCTLFFLKLKEIKFISVPLISLITGIIFFSNHSPMWNNHRVYLILPICWIASLGFYKLCGLLALMGKSKDDQVDLRQLLGIVCITFALGWSFFQMPSKYLDIRNSLMYKNNIEQKVVESMRKYRDQVHLVVTDYPFYAFLADMPSDPHLILTSQKIIATKIITADDYLKAIQKENPELVLLARFPILRARLTRYLQKDYVLEYTNRHGVCLYVLKKIKADFGQRKVAF